MVESMELRNVSVRLERRRRRRFCHCSAIPIAAFVTLITCRTVTTILNQYHLSNRICDHEQARTFHLASELSQRVARTRNSSGDRTRKSPPNFAEKPMGRTMTVTRLFSVAIAAG